MRITRVCHQARFPYLKTIEELDFTFQTSIRRPQLGPFQNGDDARFVTATDLIDELAEASHKGALREVTAQCVQPHVLVIAEVGSLQHATAAANVLYGVIDQRCLRKKPIILTTNKKLREWGEVLHDPQRAEALLDRILERGQHIALGGNSWRIKSHQDPDTLAMDQSS